MTLRRAYAALAIVGAILPYAFFIPWVRAHGFDWGRFFALPFASGPGALFASDLLYAALVFMIFAVAEGRRVGVRPIWLAPVAIWVVGLCFALPLFLWLRERARDAAPSPRSWAAARGERDP